MHMRSGFDCHDYRCCECSLFVTKVQRHSVTSEHFTEHAPHLRTSLPGWANRLHSYTLDTLYIYKFLRRVRLLIGRRCSFRALHRAFARQLLQLRIREVPQRQCNVVKCSDKPPFYGLGIKVPMRSVQGLPNCFRRQLRLFCCPYMGIAARAVLRAATSLDRASKQSRWLFTTPCGHKSNVTLGEGSHHP